LRFSRPHLLRVLAVAVLSLFFAGCRSASERDVKAASIEALKPEDRAAVESVIKSAGARCVTIHPTPEIYGSGALISDDGWILTAEHVTLGKKVVRVTLPDGTECAGRVIAQSTGADGSSGNDYALVKVAAKGLPCFKLTPRRPELGERIVAVGTQEKFDTPNGSTGFVVYPRVRLPGEGGIYYYDAIFHTAPIDHGDSGGPLVDMNGYLVGIHGGFAQEGSSNSHATGPHHSIAAAMAEILKRLPNKGNLSGAGVGEGGDPGAFPIPWPAQKPRDFAESALWTTRSLEDTLTAIQIGDPEAGEPEDTAKAKAASARATVDDVLERERAKYVGMRTGDERPDDVLVRAMLHDIFADLDSRRPGKGGAVASGNARATAPP
jgi:S1-C subfamily serine protease